MVEAAVRVEGLRKTFRARGGPRVAVDGLDLVVPYGGVHGFLGPNGSGKTTTLRMLLGLVRPDAGTIRLFGQAVPDRLPDVMPRIGAVVEQPQFFPAFSGRLNLELLAGAGRVPAERVDQALDTVGLVGRARDRYRAYSLGMKQRLAIAATLLKRPDLLLLDEPTNGLDPAGIREMRELFRRLGGAGITVLVSSHLLGEVEQMCDSVSILSAGRHVASGDVRDVLASHRPRRVLVDLVDRAAGEAALTAAGLRVTRSDEHLVVHDVDDPAEVNRVLGTAGLWARHLRDDSVDLESVFLELTSGGRSA